MATTSPIAPSAPPANRHPWASRATTASTARGFARVVGRGVNFVLLDAFRTGAVTPCWSKLKTDRARYVVATGPLGFFGGGVRSTRTPARCPRTDYLDRLPGKTFWLGDHLSRHRRHRPAKLEAQRPRGKIARSASIHDRERASPPRRDSAFDLFVATTPPTPAPRRGIFLHLAKRSALGDRVHRHLVAQAPQAPARLDGRRDDRRRLLPLACLSSPRRRRAHRPPPTSTRAQREPPPSTRAPHRRRDEVDARLAAPSTGSDRHPIRDHVQGSGGRALPGPSPRR